MSTRTRTYAYGTDPIQLSDERTSQTSRRATRAQDDTIALSEPFGEETKSVLDSSAVRRKEKPELGLAWVLHTIVIILIVTYLTRIDADGNLDTKNDLRKILIFFAWLRIAVNILLVMIVFTKVGLVGLTLGSPLLRFFAPQAFAVLIYCAADSILSILVVTYLGPTFEHSGTIPADDGRRIAILIFYVLEYLGSTLVTFVPSRSNEDGSTMPSSQFEQMSQSKLTQQNSRHSFLSRPVGSSKTPIKTFPTRK
jgi:hypothetical protein